MQSSVAVAGMDALSYPCENILARRANQRHYSIIAQFAKRPWPCPTTGSSSAIAGKKSLRAKNEAFIGGDYAALQRLSARGSPHLKRSPLMVRSREAASRTISPEHVRPSFETRPRGHSSERENDLP